MSRPLALVTGGWRRIGAAIASALAGAGWDLVLHAHQAGTRDAVLEGKLVAAGAAVQFVHGDLADPAFVTGLIAEAGRLAGRPPSLLVNCASLFGDDSIADVSPESLSAHFAVNLHAPVLLARALADALGDQPGAVVHVLDQRVVNPVPDQLSYTLSKQALHGSVRTLARALAPRIRVNAVAPGLTLPTGDYDAAQWQRLAGIMPLGHLPTPEEIAGAVVYLAGARSVTGQTLFVDAGANLEAYPRDFVYLEA
jgi:NAD(P)-dependent dehydrogenase (short-subunit alcohol dehydrogenase family)